MHRKLRRFGVAAVLASSVSFAQSSGVPLPQAPLPAPSSVAQPDTLSKLSSSVKDAYSEIDQAKGVLSGHSPTKNHTAASLLGQAEHSLGTASSALPAGQQQQGTSLIDTAKDKVASARTLLHSGNLKEAQKVLGEIPPLESVEKSLGLSGATGIGGAGSMGVPPSGTSPTK